ncbi:hypothetical protein GIY23_12145 [Allosaccharopolyspora coralli]|uniref:Ion transporter n=1 Tax=Allosaccharopolyspora coralli TaxID=2665642 RepID=A0A5Q3QH79_9PSEU|nr:hypothetical protein [Allosaccharopolyspora coralli]QGK70177.1 hypothetical protein GIY23_12145 [Allosaccharopolyspora coralli]
MRAVEATGGEGEPVWERYLEPFVLVAAVASVPAVFLATFDGPFAVVGVVLNWLSMIVLTAESALLLWSSADRMRWLRSHWWLVVITVVTIPAVIFAIGPVQVLRLVRVVAAIQLVRVTRLVTVARVLRRRLHLYGPRWHAVRAGLLLLAVVFLSVLLSDPTSTSRRLLGSAIESIGPVTVATIGLITVLVPVMTWLLVRTLQRRTDYRCPRHEHGPADDVPLEGTDERK